MAHRQSTSRPRSCTFKSAPANETVLNCSITALVIAAVGLSLSAYTCEVPSARGGHYGKCCSPVGVHPRRGKTSYLRVRRLQQRSMQEMRKQRIILAACLAYSQTLMKGAECSSETSVNFYRQNDVRNMYNASNVGRDACYRDFIGFTDFFNLFR